MVDVDRQLVATTCQLSALLGCYLTPKRNKPTFPLWPWRIFHHFYSSGSCGGFPSAKCKFNQPRKLCLFPDIKRLVWMSGPYNFRQILSSKLSGVGVNWTRGCRSHFLDKLSPFHFYYVLWAAASSSSWNLSITLVWSLPIFCLSSQCFIIDSHIGESLTPDWSPFTHSCACQSQVGHVTRWLGLHTSLDEAKVSMTCHSTAVHSKQFLFADLLSDSRCIQERGLDPSLARDVVVVKMELPECVAAARHGRCGQLYRALCPLSNASCQCRPDQPLWPVGSPVPATFPLWDFIH